MFQVLHGLFGFHEVFPFYKLLFFLPKTNKNPVVENLGMPFSVLILPVLIVKI